MLSLDATLLLRLVTLGGFVAILMLRSRSRLSLRRFEAGLLLFGAASPALPYLRSDSSQPLTVVC
jgi:hypothetical protein